MSDRERGLKETEKLKQVLDELLAPERLPSDVKSARFEFGTDHVGEPAIKIFLGIEPGATAALARDRSKRAELVRFRQNLTNQIVKLESEYFPSIRLGDAA